MKSKLICIMLLSFSLLFYNCNGSDTPPPASEPVPAPTPIPTPVVDLNELLRTKEVLKSYELDEEREQRIEFILNYIGSYLIENIDDVIEDNAFKKKNEKNYLNLKNKFRNGKVSFKTIETLINDMIETFNDKHIYNRLYTISLDHYKVIITPSLYNKLNTEDWKDDQTRKEIEGQIMLNYSEVLQSDNIFNQMIGIK